MKTADYWIRRLKLRKHPEGGFYREVYRAAETIGANGLPSRYRGKRSLSTSIYFLLRGRDVSRFHRLKSDETWHFYRGTPLTIHVISPRGRYSAVPLGKGSFQHTVCRGSWFGATVDGARGFALVGCTVAPGFDFADLEMGTSDKLPRYCPGAKRIIGALTVQATAVPVSEPEHKYPCDSNARLHTRGINGIDRRVKRRLT